MTYAVDFNTLSTDGLESSPVTAALAGLRANEARYFKNKYDHVFTVEPASDAKPTIDWVHRILKQERDIVISSRPLVASAFQIENIRRAYVFYESGLSINVMYTVDDPDKRAVGFKLSAGPPSDLLKTHRDELPHKRLGQRAVNGKVKCALRHRVARQLVAELCKD